MDKTRDGNERGEKGRSGAAAGLPQGMDPTTAALYANMFGAGGLGAYGAAAAAAAAAMGGMGAMPGLPPGYPPVSSSAGLASIAAAQQAQQAQVAALAGLGPSAAWWNIAGLQQMELLSRLQGGMGGLGGYPGIHPEHLMNLELLQAQQAAAMAAALSASTKTTSATSRTSSNSSSNSTGSGTGSGLKPGSRPTTTTSSRSSLLSNHHSAPTRVRDVGGSSRSGSSSSHHESSSRLSSSASRLPSSHHSPISVRSDLGAASSNLSYGIASLMADKHPSSHRGTSGSSTPASSRPPSASAPSEHVQDRLSSNGGMSLSKAIRNKELEIIPISSSLERLKDHASSALSSKERSSSNGSANSMDGAASLAAHFNTRSHLLSSTMDASPSKSGSRDHVSGGGSSYSREKNEPKVSISSLGALQLTNGSPSLSGAVGSSASLSSWRDEGPSVSIEPCGGGGGTTSTSTGGEDGPLNLSLKSSSSKNSVEKSEKKEQKDSRADLLNKLKPPLNPFDYSSGMGLGMGLGMGVSPSDMAPSLEMLQSLYGHHGEPRDVLASMQEALQRQLLMADSKRKEDKKRRVRNNSSLEESQERARHLGRGVSKPKKNTVASLLEHCRAAGIKPQLPLPPTTSFASTPVTTSPPLSSPSPSISGGPATGDLLPPRPSSSGSSQSLPPSLIPLFPQSLPPSLTATLGGSSTRSSASPSLPPPPTPSVSISTFPSTTTTSTTTVTPSISSLLSFSTPTTTTAPVSTCSFTSSSSSPLLPLSLPPSLSISSCLNTTTIPSSSSYSSLISTHSTSADSSGGVSSPAKPSITLQPASALSNVPSSSSSENRVEITPISSSQSGDEKSSLDTPSKRIPSLTLSAIAAQLAITPSSLKGHGLCEYSELSDSESEDDSSSVSSMDDESGAGYPSPWLKRDTPDSHSTHSGSPPPKKRKMITDEASLRVPLLHGWRRETTMRGITQSGVRGEVIYYAPCGKAFKQYPDIIRYLERQNINDVTRDNFSFSSKIAIGEYVDATTQNKYSEQDIRDIVAEIRAKRGLREMKHAQNTKHEVWKEQEKLKKQEELRKEKEEQRKQREEINRQRLYEQLRKAQEREQEKQKQKLLKEQERERRRYHGILVRSLEARKRYEEREKRRECQREEKRVCKEKKREERLAARELNLLLKEVKEDMELTDHRPLPDIPFIKGLRLPPEAFGNVLMIFEFLHNFGETLGFDMDSLPSLQSLQLALLGDHESEEELLSILSHLLVCAIEDPGIPNSQRNTTILGQTLNRADITHTNISEILRVYLYANATGEVRTIHGLHGTEKEKRETPSKAQEWDDRLVETDAYRMSLWLQRVPLLALNPTQKSEVIAYVCNELLQNKAVLKQIEDSLDRHNGLKTEKWKIDARIRSICRRLRTSLARKKLYQTAMRNLTDHREDSNLSTNSNSNFDGEKSLIEKKDEKMKLDDELEEEEDNENESANDSEGLDEVPDEEEDKNLNIDDATKTLEQLQKEMDQVRQELFETSQQVRGYNCGQDRFQRTMWVLPHAGGPYLEGLSSCDYVGRCHFPTDVPHSQPKMGLTFEEHQELRKKLEKEMKNEIKKEEVKQEEKPKLKEEKKMNDTNLVNGRIDTVPKVEQTEPDDKKINGSLKCEKQEVEEMDNRQTPTSEIKTEMKPQSESVVVLNGIRDSSSGGGNTPTPTPTPTPINIVAEPVDKDLVATGLGLIPGQYLRPEHVAQCEKLSFNLLPRLPCDSGSLSCSSKGGSNSCRGTPFEAESPFLSHSVGSPMNPATPTITSPATVHLPSGLHNSIVAQNLSQKELLEKLHQTAEALPIPAEYKTGWWYLDNHDLLKEFTDALNDRGARESELKRFLERNFSIVTNSVAKVDSDAISIDPLSSEEEIISNLRFNANGIPVDDDPQHWSVDTSLRLDLFALEAVYAMEEKITNASMQNKNWKLSENEKGPIEWHSSCLSPIPSDDESKPPSIRRNPIHIGRERLLSLEEGIERRYLKPPLGVLPTPKNESTESRPTDPPKGLCTWKEAVANCETAAQLAMCTYMLETAVAWDKSIMKAYCQFCHSGDFEEKLLLCDGCDKGYHMHCFKPPMQTIPDGDWYCYECVNKFSDSSQRHCLVCGGIEGRTLLHCSSCPRAYHTTCINPPISKVPRNKWNCPACSSRSPRGRRGRTKKPSEGPGAAASAPPNSTVTNSPSSNCNFSQNTNPTPEVPATQGVGANPPVSTPPQQGVSSTTVTHQHSVPSTPPTTISSSPVPIEAPPTQGHYDGDDAASTTSSGMTNNTNGPQSVSLTVTPNTTPKKERGIKKKDLKDLATCKQILSELEIHEDAWPFLLPVNTRQFPTYKKIIRKPVDLSTIRKKLDESQYRTKEDFCDDLRLMFNNCETFNEDDSPVGKAGHNLRSFFEAKLNENFASTLT